MKNKSNQPVLDLVAIATRGITLFIKFEQSFGPPTHWASSAETLVDSMNAVYSKKSKRNAQSSYSNYVTSPLTLTPIEPCFHAGLIECQNGGWWWGKEQQVSKRARKIVYFSLHLYICSAQAVTTNFAICFCMKSPSSFKSSVKVTKPSISLEAAML